MSFYYINGYVSPNQTLPFNINSTRTDETESSLCFELHNHDVLELNAVISGKIMVSNDQNRSCISKGETILSNPFVLHEGEWLENGEYMTLTINLKALLSHNLSVLNRCLENLTCGEFVFDESYPCGSRIFKLMSTLRERYYEKTPAAEADSLSLVYEILSELFRYHYHKSEDSKPYKRNIDFMKDVTRYISQNYHRDITTKDIASALFMEISLFCRTFKKHYGISFSNHLCKYRCIKASELYKTSKSVSALPLSELAQQVGFKNYFYFSKSFKKYIGQTPAVYFGKQKRGHINEKDNA